MELTAAEITRAVSGRLASGDPDLVLTAVTIDSRQVPPGSLFVPLKGSRVDGHEFIAGALAGGARGVLTARPGTVTGAQTVPVASGVVAIEVGDTLAALQALAAAWRERLGATVIGVAGSNGKTTTKEALASVLRVRLRTFATPRNENSQIGAPLTILATPRDTQALVLELGTSAPGELARLARITRPDLAIVTAAQAEHLEWLGSIDGVIAAESEILASLRPGSLALVGSAEPKLVQTARRWKTIEVRSLGRRGEDDFQLGEVSVGRDGTRFRLTVRPAPGAREPGFSGRVPLLGEPAAWAAGFAVAVAGWLGFDAGTIQAGLDTVGPVAHRLVPLRHAKLPLFVIDDCYNSNPASALAAIETAVALAGPNDRLILVLGDMLELGESTEQAHRELGRAIRRQAPGVALVVAVGESSRLTAETARADGVAVEWVADAEAAAALVEPLTRDGQPTTLLVKGSRGIALERVVEPVMRD